MSVFDNISSDDVIMAFFPCTMFQENNRVWFSGNAYQLRNYTDERKLELCITRHDKLNEYYKLICMMFVVAYRKGLQMVVENPATSPNYLESYFPVKPTFTDKNRRDNGDYYKKPTNFWFVGFRPKQNLVFEPIEYVDQKIIEHLGWKPRKEVDVSENGRETDRSMIHPQYASRFIRQYILDGEND